MKGLLVSLIGGFAGPCNAFIVVHSKCSLKRRQSHLCERERSNAPIEIDKDDKNKNNNQDFPTWLKALTRWNTQDASSRSSPFDGIPFIGGRDSLVDDDDDDSFAGSFEDMISPTVASLSGMVNLEALLVASNSNETDDEINLLLPEMNYQGVGLTSSMKLFPFLDNALRWEDFAKNIQELTALIPDDRNGMNVTFEELVNMVPSNEDSDENDDQVVVESNTERILQDATQQLESLISATSSVFTPSAFQSLILRASSALAIQEASGNLTAAAYAIFEQAGRAPKATAEYTAELVKFANGVIVGGYTPLFKNYPSVRSIPVLEQRQKLIKAAEFATLSGAIYESTVPKIHSLNHSIVAQGKTANIGWMVTDSIQYEQDFQSESSKSSPTLVRTFVLRGYDATDETVDREKLLNVICTASPIPILEKENTLIQAHEGMLSIARELMRELEKYIAMTSPAHKFVFAGHSIGGALSILLMILLVNDRGVDFVRQRVLRVFAYGSPPILELLSTTDINDEELKGFQCSILEAFDLPSDIVYSYNQPWDPIIRLYSQFDPLYPLIDDLGEDGYTPWVSGPSRTLRPIVKTILESWEGWPRFRDNARVRLGQNYRSVGEQYLLLPEPTRYLTDRLVSVNTQVPEVDTIVQLSSKELLPALNEVFLLDTFSISYVSTAIRSFIHHFHPAYGQPIADYAKKVVGKISSKENSRK